MDLFRAFDAPGLSWMRRVGIFLCAQEARSREKVCRVLKKLPCSSYTFLFRGSCPETILQTLRKFVPRATGDLKNGACETGEQATSAHAAPVQSPKGILLLTSGEPQQPGNTFTLELVP